MPDHLPPGTLLSDLSKKQWVLGQSVGTGGFGEIYLATEGGKGEQKVVKIEPHENGPLFVEMHFYIAAGKPEHLQEWKKSRKGKDIPHLPMLRGHGSYQHKATDTYRFLVIDRLGKDLDKTFKNGANPLSMGTVASVTVQVVTALEYIHSRGFTHNDVKAANLLLGVEEGSKDMYLVDFGLCVKYMKGGMGGTHKEYRADPRKAHDGTIEYLSRDAHIGCTSRRSDMEVLGYNIIHWLVGTLPWQGIMNNPAKVQAAKEMYMKDLTKNMVGLPKQVQEFMKYVAGLKFEEEPDYDKLRGLFMSEVKKCGGRMDLGDGGEVSKAKGRKGGKKAAAVSDEEDSVSEKENNSSPVKKVRKAVVKKAPVVESDSEEDFEPSPVPAKKAKKAAVIKAKKPVKAESEGDSEDMFSSSPSPLKKMPTHPKYQEAACQTSPAFVAAAKAARRGKKALAMSEYKANGDTPSKTRETPTRSTAGRAAKDTPTRDTPGRAAKDTPSKEAAKSTPTRPGRSSARSTPTASKVAVESTSVVIPGIANPTPAMLAIFNKKKQAEEEKAGKKRKK